MLPGSTVVVFDASVAVVGTAVVVVALGASVVLAEYKNVKGALK